MSLLITYRLRCSCSCTISLATLNTVQCTLHTVSNCYLHSSLMVLTSTIR